MYSKLLDKHQVKNKIAGSNYNFRYQKVGDLIIEDMGHLLAELSIQPDEIYSGQQTHSANVQYTNGDNGEEFIFGRTFQDTDGLITDQPNVALLIKFADCTPIVLYDPKQKVLACVHSGWRGTVKKIAIQALEKMTQNFGCIKEEIVAYIGPSIDQKNYEVGQEVYDEFAEWSNRDEFFVKKENGKYLLSMIESNRLSLLEAGLIEQNIEVESASTYTDSRLHSARQEGKDYQLNAIVVMMQP